MDNKIIQIIPCGELYAVFKDKKSGDQEVEEWRDRVVCLALMESLENENDRWVAGLILEDSYFSNPEDIGNFDRYEFKAEGGQDA